MKKILSKINPDALKAEAEPIPHVLSNRDQHIIDDLINRLSAENLYQIGMTLQKAAMDDVNGVMQQVEEDQEKELAWLRR